MLGNAARIAGLLVLLAAVPAVLQAGRMRTPGAFWWLTLALFLWFCCSYFWTIDPVTTLEKIRGLFSGDDDRLAHVGAGRHSRRLALTFCARPSPAVGCWRFSRLRPFRSPEAIAAGQVRFAAYGQDPNEVARFLDLGFPLAALLVNCERRWPPRLLAIGFFPLGIVAVLLTASREGFLAAVIGIAGSIILLTQGRARRIVATAFALPPFLAALWLIVPAGTLARLATIPEQIQTGDLNQRLNIWSAGWRAFAHAPIFGTGAGSFVAAAHLSPIDTAHNTALSIAVGGGLCAVVPGCGPRRRSRFAPRFGPRGPLRLALITSLLGLGSYFARRHCGREPHHMAAAGIDCRCRRVSHATIPAGSARASPRIRCLLRRRLSRSSSHNRNPEGRFEPCRSPRRCRALSGFSINRAIFRAAVSVGAAGIFVKILATFKEVAVASVYGRSDAMDAFLAAALIPSLLVNLISESMNQALVPTLVRVREQEGRERAQQLLVELDALDVPSAGRCQVVMALAARGFFPLIASHFAPAKLTLAVHLFYGLLPMVLITGIATNCTAVLNTVDRFAIPALAPMVISIAIILGALLLVDASASGPWCGPR